MTHSYFHIISSLVLWIMSCISLKNHLSLEGIKVMRRKFLEIPLHFHRWIFFSLHFKPPAIIVTHCVVFMYYKRLFLLHCQIQIFESFYWTNYDFENILESHPWHGAFIHENILCFNVLDPIFFPRWKIRISMMMKL